MLWDRLAEASIQASKASTVVRQGLMRRLETPWRLG
jgi:hypothetical protein